MNDLNSILFNIAESLPGFLLAIVVHEAAHAWMANKFGDPTAKNLGRLTLNPAAHYDPIGTIFFPLLAAMTNFAIIGYARPVPIEIRNFKNLRKGIFWVSFAGPLSNILLAIISAILFSLIVTQVSRDWGFFNISLRMLQYSILINCILAFFNLIPIPPLDGSKMVSSFLRGRILYQYESLAKYTPALMVILFALSIMKYNVFGWLFKPVYLVANSLLFGLVGLFGGIG